MADIELDSSAAGDAIVTALVGKSPSVAALTATGDVQVSKGSPLLSLYDTAGTVDERNWQIGTFVNDFRIRLRNDANSATIQTVLRAEDNELILAEGGIPVNMAGATAVTVPAAADGDTTTAAQTTALDSTTGQVQVNGAEVGDTGWREVRTLHTFDAAINSTGATSVLMRRTGDVVYVQCTFEVLSSITNNTVTLTPFDLDLAGFGATPSVYIASMTCAVGSSLSQAPGTLTWHSFTGNGSYVRGASGTSTLRATFFYFTADAWPATLPGTAA